MKKLGFKIKWLAISCFEISYGGKSIVFDPCVTECKGTDLDYTAIDNCDYICLTHPHWDHITDIPRLLKTFKPMILCGDQTALPLAEWLNYNPSYVYPMNPDLELDFGAFKVRALFGKHSDQSHAQEKTGINDMTALINQNPICLGDEKIANMQALGSMEYRNYLITLSNGTKIVMWGNDARCEQVNILKKIKPDLLIIQRSTDAKGVTQKADLVKEIGCKIVIPHHHDFTRVDPEEICGKLRDEIMQRTKKVNFIMPKHGEWIEL